MTYTIKIIVFAFLAYSFTGCITQSPKPEECNILTIRVDTIYEGGVKDVAFKEHGGQMAYINRALENGYTLQELREKTLNKEVTLHLAKTITGSFTNSIVQLVVENDTIYTEFNDTHLRGQ